MGCTGLTKFENGLIVSVGDTGDQASSNERIGGPLTGLTGDMGEDTDSDVEVVGLHSIDGQNGLSNSAGVEVAASISKCWHTPGSS